MGSAVAKLIGDIRPQDSIAIASFERVVLHNRTWGFWRHIYEMLVMRPSGLPEETLIAVGDRRAAIEGTLAASITVLVISHSQHRGLRARASRCVPRPRRFRASV